MTDLTFKSADTKNNCVSGMLLSIKTTSRYKKIILQRDVLMLILLHCTFRLMIIGVVYRNRIYHSVVKIGYAVFKTDIYRINA